MTQDRLNRVHNAVTAAVVIATIVAGINIAVAVYNWAILDNPWLAALALFRIFLSSVVVALLLRALKQLNLVATITTEESRFLKDWIARTATGERLRREHAEHPTPPAE